MYSSKSERPAFHGVWWSFKLTILHSHQRAHEVHVCGSVQCVERPIPFPALCHR